MYASALNNEKVIRTNCRACHGGCGVLVTVKVAKKVGQNRLLLWYKA
ncbi:MAG: hypothetical protein HY782_05890 [Chloroflexi bacterium]|nr:hypothetical protein [Chloroflexota bacterium]